MRQGVNLHGWRIVEDRYEPGRRGFFESLFSLGNGAQGHRGALEEDAGDLGLPACYVGGIHYPETVPDLCHQLGMPRHVHRMPQAANWLGIHVVIDGEPLPFDTAALQDYRRTLDMRHGLLKRTFTLRIGEGKSVKVETQRFQSMDDQELGLITYAITPLDFAGTLTLIPYLDINVANRQAPVEEGPWVEVETQVKRTHAHLLAETRRTGFQLCSSMKVLLFRDEKPVEFRSFRLHREKYVASSIDLTLQDGERIEMQKFCSNISTLHHPREGILDRGKATVKRAAQRGLSALKQRHRKRWDNLWEGADIRVQGDPAAQQGLRFSIFHLLQAYHGRDERLSLLPSGYSAARHQGGARWTAEVFGLPVALGLLGGKAARNMLLFRFRQLPEAIRFARRLGFSNGAALFPMETLSGQECHTDWPHVFGAVHRNGALAFSLAEYLRYTGDKDFLVEHGLEVLVALARFWNQRLHFAKRKEAYVLHGVQGPNSYAGTVNNNWHTNIMAQWTLRYAAARVEQVRDERPEAFRALAARLSLDAEAECTAWRKVAQAIYLPYDPELGIFPEHDGMPDRELNPRDMLPPEQLPLSRHWTRDRIARSGYVGQPDVLLGLHMLYSSFQRKDIARNLAYYEPLTLHESDYSYGLHALLTARLGEPDKAYAHFIRSARFDLDDHSGSTHEGCHLISMAATWMAMVYGFGGLEIRDDSLSLYPTIPSHWQSYTFRIHFRSWHLEVRVSPREVVLLHHRSEPLRLLLYGKPISVQGGEEKTCSRAQFSNSN